MEKNYKASRFNALTNTEEDGLILFNSYTGALADFSTDEKEEVMALVKREMEEVIKLKVPLKVEIATGKNWDEAH